MELGKNASVTPCEFGWRLISKMDGPAPWQTPADVIVAPMQRSTTAPTLVPGPPMNALIITLWSRLIAGCPATLA